MTDYLIDWLSLLGRWFHFIVGIAWIGSSFYFVWLDNHLRPPEDPELARKGVGGELWAVHGGGFYNAHKYRVAPHHLPAHLHWFYWEAYSTFLSGLFLLCLIYYGQAQIYLIDPSVAALSKPAAIAIAVSFLVGGWLVYDGLCRTALARNGAALGGSAGRAVLGGSVGFVPFVQRARRVHPVRRDARHDHGGECVLRHHSRPTRDGARQARRARAGSPAWDSREAEIRPQHLFHVARAVHDDQPSLCDDVWRDLQLAGADCDQHGRRADPGVFRVAAQSA